MSRCFFIILEIYFFGVLFFLFYLFIYLFIYLFFFLGGGEKGKKYPKMKNNNYISHVPYLKNSIAYGHSFWYNCVKWWYLQGLFIFKKIFIFSFFVSQELYLIWLWFLVHMCKMMISPAFFFFFFSYFQKVNYEVCSNFFTCVWFFLHFSFFKKRSS